MKTKKNIVLKAKQRYENLRKFLKSNPNKFEYSLETAERMLQQFKAESTLF